MSDPRQASLAAFAIALAMLGCAARPPTHATASVGAPAPDSSPLAKVHKGMGMKEVSDLVGQPTDQNSHMTGKAFIPYYAGPDAGETVWYYKNEGRIVFNHGNNFVGPRVIRVEYDPTEYGYTR